MRERWISWRSRRVRDSAHEAHVRRNLIGTLYASPGSLAVGALAGSAIGLVIARLSADSLIRVLVIMVCAVAAVRALSGTYFHRRLTSHRAVPTRAWEIAYELGAWIYAGLLGLLAFATLIRSDNMALHLLSVSLATGYAGAASGRNAGRVHIAVGQCCLILLPTAAGLWLHDGTPYRVLSLLMIFTIFGMAEISATTHRIVLKAFQVQFDKSQLAENYERLARFDSLTGVENRMAMQDRLKRMMAENRQAHDALAILWLDLDRFKEINDTLGHIIGDRLLSQAASRLKAVLDDRGHVSRFGGDEFVVICPDAGRIEAQEIADRILGAFGESFHIEGHMLTVSVSVGIAIAPQDGRDGDEVLQHADVALYEAKRRGRAHAVSFSWGMKERFSRDHEMEAGLRRAIENDELWVVYQPIVELETGRVAACEALLRWTHPMLGRVPPAEFIPVAESIGLIEPITAWVVRQACAAAMEWPEEVRVAVNISAASLKSGELPANIIATLLETGLPARRLELEVTESIFLEQGGHSSRMLDDLRRIGLRLALDDFGTGYSSLSYLRAHRFDTIKVDQSFMAGVREHAEDQAIVKAVGSLASALRMETVAEGIETIAQLHYARAAGFTNAQGFLLCKPVTQAEVKAMMADGPTLTGMSDGTAARHSA